MIKINKKSIFPPNSGYNAYICIIARLMSYSKHTFINKNKITNSY